MLISQPISRCLTNHSELCMSRLLNNGSRRIAIYRLQRRPSFCFESSVSLTPMTSGDPVVDTELGLEAVDEDIVIDSIKRCPNVEGDQSCDLFVVGGRVHCVHDMQ